MPKAKGDKLVEEARAQRDKLVGKASGKLARIAAPGQRRRAGVGRREAGAETQEQAEQQIAAQQQ